MSEAELRQVLKGILDLGDLGRLHPDERAAPGTEPLLMALGTIAALATVALGGDTIPPQRIELSEREYDQINAGFVVTRQTQIGYRVELALAE